MVAASFVYIGYLLYQLARKGIRVRKSLESSVGHKALAKKTVVTTIVAILLTEAMVRVAGGSHVSTQLITHFAFSFPFLALLLIVRFKITGQRNARRHRFLSYATIVFYLGTVITGIPLLVAL